MENRQNSKLTKAIDAETKRVRNDEKWRDRYVTWEMDLSIIQEDAEKKGRKDNALENAKALKKQGKLTDAEISEVTKVPLQVVAAMPAI